MPYKIIIYCPDRHIEYHASTPDKQGVGGGIVARIRLAQYLAELGHQVTMISNVERAHSSRGARFLPLAEAGKKREADVLLLMSSGDNLSLEKAVDLPVKARLREAWVQGTIPIKGIRALDLDYVIAPSNFVHRVVEKEWGISDRQIFVIYNGLTEYVHNWKFWEPNPPRDPYSLMYFSHPSKGLGAALEVVKRLRDKDERYHLHVFGGNALWGGDDEDVQQEGVIYHGTVGQQELSKYLKRCNFSIHLQARQEPFGMVVTESMKQGCIPLASPVGAYPETIQNGRDGFLVSGEYTTPETQQRAADIIHSAVSAPAFTRQVRRSARNIPWTWETQAQVFEQHWSWELDGIGTTLYNGDFLCPRCGGAWLLAADGYHCLNCGRYAQDGRE